jgi:hypothetical protein
MQSEAGRSHSYASIFLTSPSLERVSLRQRSAISGKEMAE